MKKTVYVLLFMAFSASSAFAEQTEKRTPIEEFRGATQFQLIKCKLEATSAILKVELGEINDAYSPIATCQKEGRAEIKKKFIKANAKLAHNTSASKILKDYYAAWLSAFNGITPEAGELKVVYEKRQSDLNRKADELWSRFEIEAGL
jgi:hypothetical protein